MQASTTPSSLVRLLDRWTPVKTPAIGQDVAERMGGWVDPLAAIRLQGVLQALASGAAPAVSRTGTTKNAQAIAQDIQRVRTTLAKAIALDPLALAHFTPDAADAGHAVYHQRHQELQRQMAQRVGALRDQVRKAVSAVSPQLRQLALLDATFEELLAAREDALLPTTTHLLERRFQQLRAAHRQAHETTGHRDDPTLWRQPGGWLDTFASDWRQALLAELDLRLEPVLGLLEALRNDTGFAA